MTRRLLACVAFASFAATSALASDLPPPRYMPPPRAPAFVPFFSWNGPYVGLNAGYGFGTSKWTDTTIAAVADDFDVKGAMVGGTLGYNAQMGSTVFGIETDIDWSDIHGSGCLALCKTSNTYLGTVRGRIGYAFDRFMPYITGGMAYGNIKGTLVTTAKTFDHVSVGFTAGGGLEYAFVNNWSAKVEYLYVDLGSANCDTICSGGDAFKVNFTTNIVRGGINYRF